MHVFVLAPAHPDILSLATHPLPHKYRQIAFVDADGNRIYTYPIAAETTVVAAFRSGANLTAQLPTNFRRYSLTYGPNVTVAAADIGHILKLRNAVMLHINCPQDVAFELSQQTTAQLGAMVSLRFLQFNMPASSYGKFDVRKFTDTVTYLEQITVDTHALTAEQVTAFVNNQGKIDNWRVKVVAGVVQFIKIRLNP